MLNFRRVTATKTNFISTWNRWRTQYERVWASLCWIGLIFWEPAVLSFLLRTWFGETCFSGSGQTRLVIGRFPLSRARISCLCPDKHTDLWMKARLPTRANQNPGSRAPSNRGRSLRRRSQSSPGRLRAFILDFPVVFHSQKARGKVRKKTSIHKNLPWHETPDMFFFFCPDKLKELYFVYLILCLNLLYF